MRQPQSENRPLGGLCVMVTRAEEPSDPLSAELRALGAEVVSQPAIRILPPDDWRPVDEALARLDEFDWLVFSSSNGVRHLLDRCDEKNKRLPPLSLLFNERKKRLPTPLLRVAAIGSGTAEALAGRGIRVDLTPDVFRAEALADALIREGAAGKRVLLARASRGRETLAERLAAAGAKVEQIVVYNSVDVERPEAESAQRLAAGEIGWITVTSSAIARSLVRMFGDELRRSKLASISPITSGVLRELGYDPAAEAPGYTLSGLTAAIVANR